MLPALSIPVSSPSHRSCRCITNISVTYNYQEWHGGEETTGTIFCAFSHWLRSSSGPVFFLKTHPRETLHYHFLSTVDKVSVKKEYVTYAMSYLFSWDFPAPQVTNGRYIFLENKFTPGQFRPLCIIIACVCVCVMCASVCQSWACLCEKTHYPFKLGSPNLGAKHLG